MVLEITDGHGKVQPAAMLTVLSAMFHPEDKARRQELLAGMHLWSLAGFEQHFSQAGLSQTERAELWPQMLSLAPTVGLLPFGLSPVLSSALTAEDVKERIEKGLSGGILAGELLLFILNCHSIGESLGVTQAVPLFVRGLSEKRIDLGPLNYRRKSAMLHEWSTYKPSAHFWGAYVMWLVEMEQDPAFSPVPSSELNFLALAEELRRRGESCFTRGQKRLKGPVLDPTKTWRTPPDLRLPMVDLALPPLPEWSQEQLGKRARQANRLETPPGTLASVG